MADREGGNQVAAEDRERSGAGWFEKRFNLTEIFSFLTNFGLFPVELDTRKPLREAVAEVGATTPREMGKVMKVVMPKLKGKADGKLVNRMVNEVLQG